MGNRWLHKNDCLDNEYDGRDFGAVDFDSLQDANTEN